MILQRQQASPSIPSAPGSDGPSNVSTAPTRPAPGDSPGGAPGAPSRSRSRLLAMLLLGLAITLSLVHLRYPDYSPSYVYTVLRYQGPDYTDIHRFPARVIGASGVPSDLPVAPGPRVAELVAEHSGVESLQTFLEQTETTAFLVAHQDRLVEERYLQGHDARSLQNTFSVSKSLTSALLGLASHDGLVELGAPITHYLPELEERDERFADITLEHLLDMRSGIRYSSKVSFPFVNADNALIYYHPDLASIVLEQTTIASEPGGFQYNNYNPPLLGLALQRATGRPAGEYLERELWRPLGAMHDAGWTIDDHGMERMESGFHASARDLARLGLLYLNHGVAEGRQVLPESWVSESTELPEPVELDRYDGRSWGYRAGWWIVPRPEGRSDFCAIGHFGQFIYVSPQHDAVFVRNGPGRGDWGDRDWTQLFYTVAEQL